MLPSAVTSVGVFTLVVVPMPSCPKAFQPQHLRSCEVNKAHVDPDPNAIITTPLLRPGTSVGLAAEYVLPRPNWPESQQLLPQHLRPEVLVITQMWFAFSHCVCGIKAKSINARVKSHGKNAEGVSEKETFRLRREYVRDLLLLGMET